MLLEFLQKQRREKKWRREETNEEEGKRPARRFPYLWVCSWRGGAHTCLTGGAGSGVGPPPQRRLGARGRVTRARMREEREREKRRCSKRSVRRAARERKEERRRRSKDACGDWTARIDPFVAPGRPRRRQHKCYTRTTARALPFFISESEIECFF